jgi:hypothetical protein
MIARRMNLARMLLCAAFCLAAPAFAQDKPADTKLEPPHHRQDDCQMNGNCEMRVIPLNNVAQQNDANEILVALRNILDPSVKIYLIASQNKVVINASPAQLAVAEQLIQDLNKQHRTYKLTYTVTDVENGKPVGTQHYSMIIVDGQRTTLKQGSKIPVATGSYSNGGSSSATGAGVQTQFTYLDVGMNFDATLTEMANGGLLKSKVEESTLGEPSVIAGISEPVVRQTVLEGTSSLTIGKPLSLGSIDITGTNHRVDIVVVMDVAP